MNAWTRSNKVKVVMKSSMKKKRCIHRRPKDKACLKKSSALDGVLVVNFL